MPGLSPIHLMVVAVVAFLVLGPEKMASTMRTVCRAWREFQAISQKPLEHLLDLADQEQPAGHDNGTHHVIEQGAPMNPSPVLAEIIGPQLLIVLGIVVLLFGSSQIPKFARSIGQASHELKKGLAEGADDEAPRNS